MKTWLLCIFLIFPLLSFSQQVADTSYHPVIQYPMYAKEKGSVVFIDEGHNNFHTKNGRYTSFSNLLESDGYNVTSYTGDFRKSELSMGKILVIANALNERNVQDWFLPNPSAFTSEEIEIVEQWVRDGGSLFLIADHMPFGGASKDLAAEFGFEFTNGFVFEGNNQGPAYFNLKEGGLTESIITRGHNEAERVSQIASFTGQAFNIPNDATSILTFNKNYVNFLPDTAWVFNDKTTQFNVGGWSQGAYKKYGKGKVVAFGEAAMFSAQIAGPQRIKMGMNNETAGENYKLLLNIIHWLDGKLE